MGKPYSEDLRRSVVHAIESGHTYEETAELCGVSVSSISRFLTRWRSTGSVNPEKFGGYKGYALEGQRYRIGRWLDCGLTSRCLNFELAWRRRRWLLAKPRSFAFFAIWVSHLKKKPARGRTRPAGRSRGAEGVVQDASQARSKKARIHR